GGQSTRQNCSLMAPQAKAFPPGGNFHEVDGGVMPAAPAQRAAVGGEGECLDAVRQRFEDAYRLARRDVVQRQVAVLMVRTAASKKPAVGRERSVIGSEGALARVRLLVESAMPQL